MLAWMAAIFYFSAQSKPPIELPAVQLVVSKLAHVVEYGVLASLLLRAILLGRGENNQRLFLRNGLAEGAPSRNHSERWVHLYLPAIGSFAIAVLYASTDELHQSFVAGRHPLVSDIGMDSVGAAVFLSVISAILIRRVPLG